MSTPTTITLNVNHLRAALITAGKDDVRYYLNGVLVEVMPRAVRIVSTDGHRLTCFHAGLDAELPDQAPGAIIVPRDILKGIKPYSRSVDQVTLEYDADNLLAPCKLGMLAGGDKVFAPIDAKYPDYTKVLRLDKPTGERSVFNPHYLADFAEVCRVALDLKPGSGSFPSIYENGKGSAAVKHISIPEFYGVLMPMTDNATAWELPTWLNADGAAPIKPAKVRKERAAKPDVTATAAPEVVAIVAPEVAAVIDPDGTLQNAGLVSVADNVPAIQETAAPAKVEIPAADDCGDISAMLERAIALRAAA